MSRAKYYVGWAGRRGLVAFRSYTEPTPGSTERFSFVVGPFATARGADIFATCARGNPHMQMASDADRIARADGWCPKSRIPLYSDLVWE